MVFFYLGFLGPLECFSWLASQVRERQERISAPFSKSFDERAKEKKRILLLIYVLVAVEATRNKLNLPKYDLIDWCENENSRTPCKRYCAL